MNLSDVLFLLLLFVVGGIFGIIATTISGVFSYLVINCIFSDSVFRTLLTLFVVLLFSLFGSMIGFIGVIGFAADENAGDIFPYYVGISLLVSILCTFGYYFIKLR